MHDGYLDEFEKAKKEYDVLYDVFTKVSEMPKKKPAEDFEGVFEEVLPEDLKDTFKEKMESLEAEEAKVPTEAVEGQQVVTIEPRSRPFEWFFR